MAYNVSVYKGGILLGTGSATGGSRDIGSYTGTAPGSGRNVQVTATGGNNLGATVADRVVLDDTTTLTMKEPAPFT
jgi:hypothetical protein